MSIVTDSGVAIGGPRKFSQIVNFAAHCGRNALPFSSVEEAAKALPCWPSRPGPSRPAAIRASLALDASLSDAYRSGQIERARAAIDTFIADNYDRADDDRWHRESLVESASIAAACATHAQDGELSSLITADDIVALIEEHFPIDDRDGTFWTAERALIDFHPGWCEPTEDEERADAEAVAEMDAWLLARANKPELPHLPQQQAVSGAGSARPLFELEHEPGLLGDIARWSQTFAFRPVTEFAQLAALATLAAVFGRRWATPTGLGLNLYIVAIGETGGGKDALLGAPKKLLADAGFRHLIGPGDFSSDAAIEKSLRTRPSQLMPLDEFGKLAQAMMGRNAPSFARLAAKALLEIYPRSAPGSEWTGKQRASDDRDCAADPIHSPTLSLLGVSTPEGFFEGMSQQTLDDGFLNRLTVVRAGKAGARQRDPARMTPPPALIDAMRDAYEASSTTGNLAGAATRLASATPAIRFARWADDDAIAAIEIVEAWEDDASEAGRRGVAGRAAEQTQKIATIRALARDPSDPAVTADDVRWAFEVVRASIETIEAGAREMMASSDFERLVQACRRAINEAGREGITKRTLFRAKGVKGYKAPDITAALDRLKDLREIASEIATPGPAGGRPGQRYRMLREDEVR